MEKKEFNQYLCAGSGGKWLGIEINNILEIVNPGDQKAAFKIQDSGKFIYRERQIPAVQLNEHLTAEKVAYHTNNRIIVCDLNDQIFGIVVDSAEEIIRIPEGQIRPFSGEKSNIKSDILDGIIEQEDRTVHVLSVEKLYQLIPSQ